MSTYLKQENGDNLLQENNDRILVEAFTTFQITKDIIGKYEIFDAVVISDVIGKYNLSSQVANSLGGCYDINGDASASITRQTKLIQLLQNNIETTLVEKTDGGYNYSCWVFLGNMATNDVIEIKTYAWNPQTNLYELYESPIIRKLDLVGSENNDTNDEKTAFFIPPIQSDRVKVTINQTVGTPKEYSWVMYKQ